MALVIDPNLKKIIKQVAIKLQLSEVLVTTVYLKYCKILKNEIETLPLKNQEILLTEEEFNKLNTSFNIKNLGKIYTNYNTYKVKNSIIYGQRKHKKNQTGL